MSSRTCCRVHRLRFVQTSTMLKHRHLSLFHRMTFAFTDLSAKKYKRAKPVANRLAGGSGVLSAATSSASLGTALSIIGIPAAVPLGAVGGCFALASPRFFVAGKKIDAKIKKHHETVTLALAKHDSVDRLVSKAINDNRLSDSEFQIIVAELEQYNVLKEKVWARLTRKPSKNNVVDVEQNKKEAHSEGHREAESEYAELAELQKKLLSTG